MKLIVNGRDLEVDVDGNTPLLWVLRDHLDLTGTKFGCGMAQCGACTVHVDNMPIRSCVTPVVAVQGRDLRAVVDHRLRVYGVQGFRIADCSVMPSVVSGNTNASAIMIGEKCAAMILEDAKNNLLN